MAVTTRHFRLSPNLLDRFRGQLARESLMAKNAAILDSCGYVRDRYTSENQSFDLIAGFSFALNHAPLQLFSGTQKKIPDRWYFGHFSYELKDQIEKGLHSGHSSMSDFDTESHFAADVLYRLKGDELVISSWTADSPEALFEKLFDSTTDSVQFQTTGLNVEVFPRQQYLETLEHILQHILRGDVYELNYCIPFRSNYEGLDLISAWRQLNRINPAPFSAFYRRGESWLLCSSPERFLRREGGRIFSQPVKGTIRRGKTEAEDKRLATVLTESEKERAENIMITDLVRNDLSKIARRGTVKVEELCGLYPFRNVFQLISTVSAELREGVTIQDIIRATFPMGSMTGAPKYRAMQLIEENESFRREIYSGSVGYITPENDFDYNVVIRSIVYNSLSGEILIPAGSAITSRSLPEQEYEECLLKAEALLQLFRSPVIV